MRVGEEYFYLNVEKEFSWQIIPDHMCILLLHKLYTATMCVKFRRHMTTVFTRSIFSEKMPDLFP